MTGLGRCARAEPNGDVVRFVLDISAASGEPKQEPEALVASVARLDLVANVFKDGKHGSLFGSRLEVRGF